MTERTMSQEEEQLICKRCGFCCDGTLFLSVPITNDEFCRLDLSESETAGRDYTMVHSCRYFQEQCSVYDIRPAVCAAYRCQLLVDFSSGRITFSGALDVISGAREMRRDIMNSYRFITGKRYEAGFRKLLSDMKSVPVDVSKTGERGQSPEILQAKCNIFEALLIRHFISEAGFGNLTIK